MINKPIERIVNVIDSIMGSGKTSWCIEFMNAHPEMHFIYCTELLKECDRITSACPRLNFTKPTSLIGVARSAKSRDLISLLRQGRNVAITHALLRVVTLSEEDKQIIKQYGYTLIIDEAVEMLENELKYNTTDMETCQFMKFVNVDDDGKVSWISDKKPGGYKAMIDMANAGTLYHHNGTFFSVYSTDFMNIMDQVYVCTYLFEATDMYRCFKMMDIGYQKYYVRSTHENGYLEYELIEGDQDTADELEYLRTLITVYDGKYNFEDNSPEHKLSYMACTGNNYGQRTGIITAVNNAKEWARRGTRNFKVKDMIWATYSNIEIVDESEGTRKVVPLTMDRYNKRFIPFNKTAVNDYMDCKGIAYLADVHYNTDREQFWKLHNIELNENLFSLYTMVQCIWRTRIRQEQPIEVYIPSLRMRTIFLAWLNGDKVDNSTFHPKGLVTAS